MYNNIFTYLFLVSILMLGCKDQINSSKQSTEDETFTSMLQKEYVRSSISEITPPNSSIDWKDYQSSFSKELGGAYHEFEIEDRKIFEHKNRSPITYKLIATERNGTYTFYMLKFLERGKNKTQKLSWDNFSNFSGQVHLINETGQRIKASKYSNGSFVGALRSVPEGIAGSLNGRQKLGVDCYIEETQHWTDWYQNGYGYLGSTYEGSTYEEVCFQEGGGDTGGNGGGGSGTYYEYSSNTAPDHFLSMAPEFKYPPNSNYEDLYPKLTEYLRNQMPNLANNTYIIDNILEYTDLTREQVIEHLRWGQGPTIEIVQVQNICSDCSDYTVGLFKTSSPNTLFLDIDMINTMEATQSGTIVGDAFIFWVGTTLLHEYVHFGDWVDQTQSGFEEGQLFEEDTYGQDVDANNALHFFK